MFRKCFSFALCFLLNSFIHAESLEEDVVKDIIAYRKDHVERFKDLAALTYSQKWPVPAIEEKTLSLLCGLEGLRKGPQKKERYQQQVQWAIDLIQRSTYDTLTKSNSEPSFSNPFLDKIKDTLSKSNKVLDETLTQHISFSVLFSIVSHWHIDREFAKKPAFKDIGLFDFIKNKKAYESLGDYADQFYTFITNKLTYIEKMDKYLQENYFEEIWQHNKKYFQIPEGRANVEVEYSLRGQHRQNIGLTYKIRQRCKYYHLFDVNVKGIVKGTKGDNTCFYHAHRAAATLKEKDDINNYWNDAECKQKSRSYMGDLVLSHLENPLIRYWASLSLNDHLNYPDYLANSYKDINNQQEWINLKKEKTNLDDENFLPLNRFYYQKDTIKAYVKTIIKGNDWAVNKNALEWIIAYLNKWNIIELGEKATKIYKKGKINPVPSKEFWLIHHTNHFMYMEDPTLTFTKSIIDN